MRIPPTIHPHSTATTAATGMADGPEAGGEGIGAHHGQCHHHEAEDEGADHRADAQTDRGHKSGGVQVACLEARGSGENRPIIKAAPPGRWGLFPGARCRHAGETARHDEGGVGRRPGCSAMSAGVIDLDADTCQSAIHTRAACFQ